MYKKKEFTIRQGVGEEILVWLNENKDIDEWKFIEIDGQIIIYYYQTVEHRLYPSLEEVVPIKNKNHE